MPRKRAVVAIYKRDGRVLKRFESIKEACEYYAINEAYGCHGFCRSWMSRILSKKGMPRGAVFFRYEDDWSVDGFEEFENPRVAPVIVTDIRSGISTWHDSVRNASQHYFLAVSTVNEAISRRTVIDGRYLIHRQKDTAEFKELQND